MIAAPPLVVGQAVHIAPRAGRNVVADRSKWMDATVIAVTSTGCSVRDSTGRLRSFGRRRDEVVAPGIPSTKLVAALPPADTAPSLSETLEGLVSGAHKALSALKDSQDFTVLLDGPQVQTLREAVTVLSQAVSPTRVKSRNW